MAIAYESGSTGGIVSAINYPAGLTAGDVLVAGVFSTATAAITGFDSQAVANYYNGLYLTIFTRAADGGEGASVTPTGGIVYASVMARYSGVNTSSPVDGTAQQNYSLATTTIVPATSPTSSTSQLVMIGSGYIYGNTVTNVAFPSGDERLAISVASDVIRLELADEALVASGSTGTRTYTTTVSGGTPLTMGVLVALAPASGGGGGGASPARYNGLMLPV